MLTLTYEYKLKPTKEQIQEIERILDVCRQVWNFALRERKDWLSARKCRIDACAARAEYIIPADVPYPNYALQCRALTEAKDRYPELKTVNAQVLATRFETARNFICGYATQRNGIPTVQKPSENAIVCVPANAQELLTR